MTSNIIVYVDILKKFVILKPNGTWKEIEMGLPSGIEVNIEEI